MSDDLSSLDYRELRTLALSMARDARERKVIFDVAKLGRELPAPKTATSVVAAESAELRRIIAAWRLQRGAPS